MHAVHCVRFADDPAACVELVDAPAPPPPGPGEVQVRVHARPIDPADVLLLQGRHLFRPPLPAPVGIEGAGEVVAAGDGVPLTAGTRVALLQGGTWRECVNVPATAVVPLPPGADLEQASMLGVNPFTAAGLLEGIPRGGTIVQTAATSAVGKQVLTLARARGVHVLCVTRREAPELDATVVTDGDGLASRLRAAAPGPILRALDAVAGDMPARLYPALAEGAELVVYGLLSSDRVILHAADVVFRGITVRGFSRLRFLASLEPARREALAAELAGLVHDRTLGAEIEARYPLAEVHAALAHHERPGRRGKILLVS